MNIMTLCVLFGFAGLRDDTGISDSFYFLSRNDFNSVSERYRYEMLFQRALKANIGQLLNLPHGTNKEILKSRKKKRKANTYMVSNCTLCTNKK